MTDDRGKGGAAGSRGRIVATALFFLSGAPGLAAQLAWTRVFGAMLGHEWPALLGVVTAFFVGYAVGARVLDARVSGSRNPARWYAGLEWFSAGWIALGIPLLPRISEWVVACAGLDVWVGWRWLQAFGVPLLVAGPAAAAMGSTLAAMDRVVAGSVPDGRIIGRLYGWNTAGAVLGVLGTVGWAMPVLGFRATLVVAAVVQAICGLAAWWLPGRSDRVVSEVAHSDAAPTKSRGPHAAWGLPFALGLLGMGFEMLGLRSLAQTTENTVHTFAAVLAVFLAGTAVGAGLVSGCERRGRRFSRSFWFGSLAIVVVLAAWAGRWSGGLLEFLRGRLPGLGGEVVLAVAVFLVPALGMGAAFAGVVQAARGPTGGVGRAVAVNALGGALGGPVFVMLVLPWTGLNGALVLVATGYLALFAATRPAPRILGSLGFGFALLSGGLLLRGPTPGEMGPGVTVTRFEEGFQATVTVVKTDDGHRALRVNQHFQQGGTATAVAARRHAHLPLLLHPNPRRALFLGLGTGVTMGAAGLHPGVEADGVELLPEVVRAMGEFEPENGGPHHRPGFRVFTADARRFARVSTNRYDVVVADLFHPSEDGAGFLYTREHFVALRERLADGGLICQWLPLHQLDVPVFRDVVATFRSVFPDASLWLLRFNVDVPVVGLVAGRAPGDWPVDPAALERRLSDPTLSAALRPAALGDAMRVLGCRLAGPESLTRIGAPGTVATDDLPVVMYRAARTVYRRDGPPAGRLLSLLGEADPGFATWLQDDAWAIRLGSFRGARDRHLRGLALDGEGKRSEALKAYLESAAGSPDYTGGYAQAVMIASAYAKEDPKLARSILEQLARVRPEQRLAGEMLGRMAEGR